jgi:N-acetyl-anhydromuramyl-L-alanine amidase AmpD
MLNATPENYGAYPFTREQLEAICSLAAQIAKHYGIAPMNILTHSEAAAQDGYGPGSGDPQTRWDFWKEEDLIHRKIRWYFGRIK